MALYFVEGLEPRRMLSRVEPAFDLDPRTESAFGGSSNDLVVAGNNAFMDLNAGPGTSSDELLQ